MKMKRKAKKITVKNENQANFLKIFYQLIADIKNPEEAQKILTTIIPQTEIVSIAKKVYLAKLLRQGVSYTQIKKELGVSSATISQTAKLLKKTGLNLALEKVEADEWAEKWSEKIKGLFS